MTLKVFQNSYSVECWWAAASEGCLLYDMINECDLLWVSNFLALGIYFLFGTEFSWNEETDTCFNVKCVLLGHSFDFLGGYLLVTACYLMVTTGYCLLTGDYWLLLLVTACSTFSMNAPSDLSFETW